MPVIEAVARVYTPFSVKFGIPRQSGLADTEGKIVFEKKYRSPEAVRGLEGFSHLWLIWEFTEAQNKKISLTVRPPRLGGNKRVGVFATRSPYRPNSMGLSSVKIDRIDYEDKDGPVIYIRGADILNGTPVFDIKPYVPYTDSHPDAAGGFADEVMGQNKNVIFPENLRKNLTEHDIKQIEDILKGDPAPHYQNDESRVYSFEFSSYNIKFMQNKEEIKIISLEKIKNEEI